MDDFCDYFIKMFYKDLNCNLRINLGFIEYDLHTLSNNTQSLYKAKTEQLSS